MSNIRKKVRSLSFTSMVSAGVFALTGMAAPIAKADPCNSLVLQLRHESANQRRASLQLGTKS